MVAEPALAFAVRAGDTLEVRVNFGVFAGRTVTNAEIDRLARQLAPDLDEFSIVAEDRHEFAHGVESALHQVRIVVAPPAATIDGLGDRIVAAAEAWAADCIADRHVEV